ncbi:hypothetical protein O181_050962 [Austropuccinia psidii MF-1]|uniref:Uncharacterized protein n=1 Tax=Austropuccinia psidii MF-1 TaxID=1389203 RepID=A0A9Q3E4R2_9BASI|nr:hypothetical protein [Austropuccinia psidii MF-1]
MSIISRNPAGIDGHDTSLRHHDTQTGHRSSSFRTPLSSIVQSQHANHSSDSIQLISSKDPASASKSLKSKKSSSSVYLTNYQIKRRKLTSSAETDSTPTAYSSTSSSTPSSPSSSPDQLLLASHSKKYSIHQALLRPKIKLNSENHELDQFKPLRLKRLKFKHTPIPTPPLIPSDFKIEPSIWSESLSPFIKRPYPTPKPNNFTTYPCIRTNTNQSSVSVSSETPSHFSKTGRKLPRSPNPTIEHTKLLLDLKKSEEQNKWWHWSINCPYTGDGNKSSHLTPLSCQNFHEQQSDQSLNQPGILTKRFSVNTIDKQPFYCSET